MKDVLVVCSSNRAVEYETTVLLSSLLSIGAGYVEQRNSADVSFARNYALTMVVEVLKKGNRKFDTVFMLDDDMYCDTPTVQKLVDASRHHKTACSGQYVTSKGVPVAKLWPAGSSAVESVLPRYLTGIGCLAIPANMVLELAEKSEQYYHDDDKLVTEFTWAGGDLSPFGTKRREWVGEDYRLCMRLGGVILCPYKVAHIKKQLMVPKELL
jgi:hypothetical protein